jgi:hypothetical protein
MAEPREVPDVVVLVSCQEVDEIRNYLALVVVPIQSAKDRGVGQALLKEAT